MFKTRRLQALGAVIENGEIKPDPDRLRPLKELPIPIDTKSLKRTIGLFSYYAQWIPKFSDKINPLVKARTFPLSQDCVDAFEL